MFGYFDTCTIRKIYCFPGQQCYKYIKHDDMAGWVFFFELFTEPGL